MKKNGSNSSKAVREIQALLTPKFYAYIDWAKRSFNDEERKEFDFLVEDQAHPNPEENHTVMLNKITTMLKNKEATGKELELRYPNFRKDSTAWLKRNLDFIKVILEKRFSEVDDMYRLILLLIKASYPNHEVQETEQEAGQEVSLIIPGGKLQILRKDDASVILLESKALCQFFFGEEFRIPLEELDMVKIVAGQFATFPRIEKQGVSIHSLVGKMRIRYHGEGVIIEMSTKLHQHSFLKLAVLQASVMWLRSVSSSVVSGVASR